MKFVFRSSSVPLMSELMVENDRLVFRQGGDEVEIALYEVPALIKACAAILELCPHALNLSPVPPGSYKRARGVLDMAGQDA